MRASEARAELEAKLLPRLSTPVKATALGKTFTIDGDRAGIAFDVDATIARGLGSSRWDPKHMLDVVMGGEAIDPVVTVDNARLERVLTRIASAVEVAPVNSRVAFPGGRPTVTVGHDGTRLDFEAAAGALREAILSGDRAVALPVESVSADVTADEARAFADGPAARAVSGPVRIKIADAVRTVGTGVFAPALRTSADGGKLVLSIDQRALRHRSAKIFASLPHHPSSAGISFRNGHPVVVPSRAGVSVAPVDWAKAVLKAVAGKGQTRVASARVTPDMPAFSTAEARHLRVDQRLATATLPVVSGIDPDAVRAAAARLDGYLLRPNGDFSFLGRVGASDEAASTLLASAVYDAAFHAGMENIYRTAPRTRALPGEPGLDAAVGPGQELAWVNHTPYGVYVRALVSGGARPKVTVALWGHSFWTVTVERTGRYNIVSPATQRLSGRQCEPRAGVEGYDIDVSRTLTRAGVQARTEHTHSHYEPVDAIVCRRR
jgi:vancomycin resistance protein YoaR